MGRVFLMTLAILLVDHPDWAMSREGDPPAIRQITFSDTDIGVPSLNALGHIAWTASDGHDSEIFFFNGATIIQVTDNEVHDGNPLINDHDQILWRSVNILFLHDSNGTRRISEEGQVPENVQFNNSGQVAWTAVSEVCTGYDVFLFDGSSTAPIACAPLINSLQDINDNGYVVWSGDHQIFVYDGTVTTQIPNVPGFVGGVRINNRNSVVWEGTGELSEDLDIFLYNGSTILQISESDEDDTDPDISDNGKVVWSSYTENGQEISFYDGERVKRLTNNTVDDMAPKVNVQGLVIWRSGDAPDGSDYDIHGYDGYDVVNITSNAWGEDYPAINSRGEIVFCGSDGLTYQLFQTKLFFSFAEYNAALRKERARWDVDGDDKIGLPDVIQSLQFLTGK